MIAHLHSSSSCPMDAPAPCDPPLEIQVSDVVAGYTVGVDTQGNLLIEREGQ